MQRKLFAAAAALGLASAAASAAGSASVSASLTLQFSLIDLLPDDGVAPWIQFSDGVNDGANRTVINGTEYLSQLPDQPAFPGNRGDLLTTGDTEAGFSTAGNTTAYNIQAHAQSTADKARVTSSVAASTNFTFSPNTELVLTGSLDQALHSSGSEYTDASYVDLYLSFGFPGTSPASALYSYLFAGAYQPADDVVLSTPINLAIFNVSGNPLSGGVHQSIGSSVLATDVPEAESAAMLLAGLLLFGVGAIRPRRARR